MAPNGLCVRQVWDGKVICIAMGVAGLVHNFSFELTEAEANSGLVCGSLIWFSMVEIWFSMWKFNETLWLKYVETWFSMVYMTDMTMKTWWFKTM